MTKILVIDDAKFVIEIIRTILKQKNYEVYTTTNPKEGIELYKKIKPDIVTLDILMKEINGIDVLKILKNINPDVKVIIITSLNNKKYKNILYEEGVVGYISKPFTSNDIYTEINKVK